MTDKKVLDNGIVNFYSGKKEYNSLSNFWKGDVVVSGVEYESGEHCFHGQKYTIIGQHCMDETRKLELLEYGKTFSKPSRYTIGAMCKKMGGKKGMSLTVTELKLWETMSIEVQMKICRWKLDTYEEVKQDLLKSGNKLLIHPAMRCSEEKLKSRIWEGRGKLIDGQIVVLGKNTLGNIWMSMR